MKLLLDNSFKIRTKRTLLLCNISIPISQYVKFLNTLCKTKNNYRKNAVDCKCRAKNRNELRFLELGLELN